MFNKETVAEKVSKLWAKATPVTPVQKLQERFAAVDAVKARMAARPAEQPKKDSLFFGSVQVVEVYVNGPHQDVRGGPEAKGHVAIIGHFVPDDDGLPKTLRGRQWVRIIAPLTTKLIDTEDVVETHKLVQPPCLVRFSFSDTGRNDSKGHSIVLFGSGELMRVGSTKGGDAVVVTKAVENQVEGGRKRVGVRFGGKERNGWAPKQAPKV